MNMNALNALKALEVVTGLKMAYEMGYDKMEQLDFIEECTDFDDEGQEQFCNEVRDASTIQELTRLADVLEQHLGEW